MATSELYRKRFSEQLRKTLSENDELSNQIFELAQNRRLTHISYEIVQDKLNMLYESIDAISNAKKLEEKYQFENKRQTELIALLQDEKLDLLEQQRALIQQIDGQKDELKVLIE